MQLKATNATTMPLELRPPVPQAKAPVSPHAAACPFDPHLQLVEVVLEGEALQDQVQLEMGLAVEMQVGARVRLLTLGGGRGVPHVGLLEVGVEVGVRMRIGR